MAGGNSLVQMYGNGTGAFGPSGVIAASVEPGAGLTAADFNGDGDKDVAVVDNSRDPSRVALLLSRDNGTFRSPRRFAAGEGPFQIVGGDFDRDGNVDLAASSLAEDRLSILFGRGDGTFQPARGVKTGNDTQELAAGDLNGDGRPDLAAVTSSGDVAVRYARADRTFRKPSDLDPGDPAYAVAIGDLDSDGRRDLVVTHSGSGVDDAVSVLHRKRRGFRDPLTVPLGEVAPQSLTVADFNRDGRLDIATGNVGDSVSLLENAGGRSFEMPVQFAAGDEPQDIQAARLDGDRKPDLVTADNTGDTVSVLINGL